MKITPALADQIFFWSNVVLVVGAAMALLGTLGNVWSGGLRDKFADERIALNERRTAEANAEAATAKLEQERLKSEMAWRRVSVAQAHILVERLKGSGLEPWVTYVGSDPESQLYRTEINEVMRAAGLTTKFFSGYEMAVGLGVKGGTAEQRELVISAFAAAGIEVWDKANDKPLMPGELEIIVGTKPPPNFQR